MSLVEMLKMGLPGRGMHDLCSSYFVCKLFLFPERNPARLLLDLAASCDVRWLLLWSGHS